MERKEEIRKRAEYIANGIMIDVQANKYNTNVYDYEKECYKHSHLMDAAIEGAKWADEHPREGLVDINKVYDFMEHKLLDYVAKGCKDWLKSLKGRVQPQNKWKPSDEQMEALWLYAEQNNYDGAMLTSLYNDLKKLKEGKV